MRFTTGSKTIEQKFFTVKREKDGDLEKILNVESKIIAKTRKGTLVFMYNNVPAECVKIGENVYTREGKYLGYRRC